ncbi:hypothetical protein [Streptomyces sp. NPDC014734]|uniref:hypothetical protein n=1 Tax=Streptomyces sp. NPDC014734 TaxID=3364886 RepID=UPI0036F8EE42
MRTYLSATWAGAVLVLLALLVPLSALSAWVDLEIDDTDRYVAAVSPLASDPQVRDTVAGLITDATTKQIDAGPLQGTVRDFLHRAVLSFTTTDAFRDAWDAANRTAHQAVTAALDGDTGEAVTIDLAPVTEQVRKNLEENGVPFADRIPVQHTDITLISADRAEQLRRSFRLLRTGSLWPAVGTVVFAVLTVGAAAVVGRLRGGPVRRRGIHAALLATAVVGLGFALGALVLRAVIAIARSRVLAEVPDGETGGAAAVYDALTESLRTTVWTVFGAGLAVALCAAALYAVRTHRWPGRTRRASVDEPGKSGSHDRRIGDD